MNKNNKNTILALGIGLFIVFLWLTRNTRMEEVSDFCGIVAALLFTVANAYYPAKLIAKKFRPWPKEVSVFFRKYLKAHIYINIIAFAAVTLHGHLAEERPILLEILYLVTIFLTVEGMLMYYRVIPGMQKKLRMLHTQQTLFVVWVLLIVIGHWFL
ncbi:MAG: hypothetical protein HY787_01265 [Deltaproteobacteria bacterium]|nr:hypothetical protein [Deltaproteobacteria bacterium]